MKNFEKDLQRLEELTLEIKKNDITLEDALKAFEEGIKLAKGLEKELDNIESTVQILMKDEPDKKIEEQPSEDKPRKSSRTSKSKSTKKDESGPELSLFDINSEVNGTRNA